MSTNPSPLPIHHQNLAFSGSEQRVTTFGLTPALKFADQVDLHLGELRQQVTRVTLVPEVDCYSVGERSFYWIHRPPLGSNSVRTGRKHALAVLQTPINLTKVAAEIRCKATVQVPYLGDFLGTTAEASGRVSEWF